ncbi:MAG: family 16 glycosylhydrolase [Lachnospiraceae bacterium]|nr:family 16 glycosylhydrolase [Lachnospiraceae bacterium]
MKRHILAIMGFAAVLCMTGCGNTVTEEPPEASPTPVKEEEITVTETPALDGYNLLWADEFDGNTLNENNWNMEVREAGWTNHELQSYEASTDNIYVEDGCLVLRAIKTVDENGKATYTSGKVNSQNKQDFTYGKVIIRAKAPEGQGLWPAGWMMPTDESHYGQWPKCGEIDIMEVLGHETQTAYTTIHYGEPHAQQQGLLTLEGDKSFSNDFHDYSVEWEPGEMRFYIDGTETLVCNDWFSAEGDNEKPYPAPFDQSFFVQMNLAVGGDWPGDPDDSTDFENAKFLIDYVRVYQKPAYDTNVEKPVYDAREPGEDGNFVTDWDFSDASEDLTDDVDWKFLLAQTGAGEAVIKDNMIEITTTNEGMVDYSVQLVFWDIPFIKGNKYRVTFDARADETRNIISCITAPFVDWIRYYPDTEFEVGPEWQTITYEFEMTEKDDPRGRLEFNLGHRGSTATVDITNVRVEQIE